MIIETEEAVLLEEDEDLASGLIGGLWDGFKDSIPEPQAKVLIQGFNLIILSDPGQQEQDFEDDDGVLGNKSESLLPQMIANILVDESIVVSQQKMVIYGLITNNIIEIMLRLGFVLNEEDLNHEKLQEMCDMISFFYDMDAYEDLIGLSGLLQSQDIPPVDRFIMAMQKYLGDDADLTVHELLLLDVSEVTLKTIADNLSFGEVTEAMPESLIQRVRGNAELIRGTMAFNHIINNGQPGNPIETYISFFGPELAVLMDTPTAEAAFQYCKELTGIFLISEINSPRLKEELTDLVHTMINDFAVLNRVESFISQLVLEHDN